MTRKPSGITSLPIPSPGITAIRYFFLALLIENFLTCLTCVSLARWPCNGPNCASDQRCSAMLTPVNPPAYFFPPLSNSEHSHGPASARQARSDHRRLEGYRRGRRRSLRRGRLSPPPRCSQRRSIEGTGRPAPLAAPDRR